MLPELTYASGIGIEAFHHGQSSFLNTDKAESLDRRIALYSELKSHNVFIIICPVIYQHRADNNRA